MSRQVLKTWRRRSAMAVIQVFASPFAVAPLFSIWEDRHGMLQELILLSLMSLMFLAVIVRGFIVRLEVSSCEVISVGWWRTRRWPLSDIDRVERVGYSGYLNRFGMPSSQLSMLSLKVGTERVDLPHMLGRPSAIWGLKSEVQSALGTARGCPPATTGERPFEAERPRATGTGPHS